MHLIKYTTFFVVYLPFTPASQTWQILFPDGHCGGFSAEWTRTLDTVCPLCHAILIGSPELRTFALILRVRLSSMNGSEMNVVSWFPFVSIMLLVEFVHVFHFKDSTFYYPEWVAVGEKNVCDLIWKMFVTLDTPCPFLHFVDSKLIKKAFKGTLISRDQITPADWSWRHRSHWSCAGRRG